MILIPSALSETITFADLGIAKEFSSGRTVNTPTGTFYAASNDPLVIIVNAYYKSGYSLTIYLNDAPVKSDNFRGGGTFPVILSGENVKKGKNTIYITGAPGDLFPFGSEYGNLIIYGTSNISSPSIFLPPPTITTFATPSPTSTPSPTPTPNSKAIAKDITFSELGLASEISSGTSFRTPKATFYSNSTDYPLEVSVISFFGGPYYLKIFLNDMQIESRKIIEGIQGETVTFSATFNNTRKGNNTIYISGYTIGRMEFGQNGLGGSGNNLIIYGDSKISSRDIFVPTTTPSPSPVTTNLIVISTIQKIAYPIPVADTNSSLESLIIFVSAVILLGFIVQRVIWKKGEAKSKETLFSMVVETINIFQSSKKYGNEFGYHTELQGWLKAHFPSAKVEVQTGASRPDIIIDNIAIEVKGPTDNRALDTLTSKCLKYLNHYSQFIIVLFEPRFSKSHYSEIEAGIIKHAESIGLNIKIIIKNGREYSYYKYEKFSKSDKSSKNQSVPKK